MTQWVNHQNFWSPSARGWQAGQFKKLAVAEIFQGTASLQPNEYFPVGFLDKTYGKVDF